MSSAAENPRAVPGGNNPPSQIDLLRETNATLLGRVEEIVVEADKLPSKVKSPKHFAAFGEVIVKADKLVKELEAQREIDKKPHWDAGKAVDAFFTTFKNQLGGVVAALQEKANEWSKEQRRLERERLDAEEARAAEARAIAARAETERLAREAAAVPNDSLLDDEDDLSTELAPAAPAPDPVRVAVTPEKVALGNGVTASVKRPWVGEITDIDRISLEKLRPYLKRAAIEDALKRYVNVGGRECLGARIYQTEETRFK